MKLLFTFLLLPCMLHAQITYFSGIPKDSFYQSGQWWITADTTFPKHFYMRENVLNHREDGFGIISNEDTLVQPCRYWEKGFAKYDSIHIGAFYKNFVYILHGIDRKFEKQLRTVRNGDTLFFKKDGTARIKDIVFKYVYMKVINTDNHISASSKSNGFFIRRNYTGSSTFTEYSTKKK